MVLYLKYYPLYRHFYKCLYIELFVSVNINDSWRTIKRLNRLCRMEPPYLL